jgi:molybdopterin converting factor small subunit
MASRACTNSDSEAEISVRIEIISWVNKFVGGPGTGEVVLTEDFGAEATVRTVLRRVTARYPALGAALWDPNHRRELGDNIEILVNNAVLGVGHELDSGIKTGDHITLLGQYMGGA